MSMSETTISPALETTLAHVHAGTGKGAEAAMSPVADRSPMPRRKLTSVFHEALVVSIEGVPERRL
jgi:hypothetical protein